ARRRLVQHFPKLLRPDHALQRPQVCDRPIGHHMRQEVHRVRQRGGGVLEPHHAPRHGQQGRGRRQRLHGGNPWPPGRFAYGGKTGSLVTSTATTAALSCSRTSAASVGTSSK